MIRVILEEGLYDKPYVLNTVSGPEQLFASLKDFYLGYVSQRTQVP